MDCNQLEQFTPAFLDGEFDAVERTHLEAHLEGCPGCRAKVSQDRTVHDALRQKLQSAARSQAPASLRKNLLTAMDREPRVAFPSVRAVARVAAAAVVVCGATAFYWYQVTEARKRYLDDAALRHARGLPFEISDGSPETAEAWFQGKLDHRVTLPRLPNVTLTGARLSNVQDRPAAHVTYQAAHPNGQRRIGLFVFDDRANRVSADSRREVRVDSSHGYNVAVWREGEIVYELVSDLEESDIRALLSEEAATPPGAVVPIRPAAFHP